MNLGNYEFAMAQPTANPPDMLERGKAEAAAHAMPRLAIYFSPNIRL